MKFLLLALLLLVGCTAPTPVAKSDLPAGATDLTDLGNGWRGFRYKGKCYASASFIGANGYTTKTVFEVTCLTPSV